MTNVPSGATGSVCFWVLVARLQTYNPLEHERNYFAGISGWFEKQFLGQNTGQKNTENLRNIRGPDRTD
jgi:hypothetical protein